MGRKACLQVNKGGFGGCLLVNNGETWVIYGEMFTGLFTGWGLDSGIPK